MTISITSKNVTRMKKRLQRALQEHYVQDIPLHLAETILAQTLGCKTAHALHQLLKEDASVDPPLSLPNPTSDRPWLSIDRFIQDYFDTHSDSVIQEFSFYYGMVDRDDCSYHFTTYDNLDKPADLVGLGIYFGERFHLDELTPLGLTTQDVAFLAELSRLMRLDDPVLSKYYGLRLCEHYGITSPSQYHVLRHANPEWYPTRFGSNIPAHYRHGWLVMHQQQFAGAFAFHGERYIELQATAGSTAYTTFEGAWKNRKSDHVIASYIYDPTYHDPCKRRAYCDYYLFDDHGVWKASTVNQQVTLEVSSLRDIFVFLAMLDIYYNDNMLRLHCSANHPYRSDVEAVFQKNMRTGLFSKKIFSHMQGMNVY